MLSAASASVRIGGATLLSEVSLDVRPGEVVVILGPNGAGKSTLLRLFAGERAPDGGRIALNGRGLRDWPKKEAARVRAVLPQSSPLSFPFLVREVVMIGRTPHINGAETDHDRQIVADAMTKADVTHLADRSYPTLSGGERQRVHLARVLAQIAEPAPDGSSRYLLLDEPTSNLDVRHQHLAMRVARRLAGDGVGVAAVLHDFNLAGMYADRIAVLSSGRLVCAGRPADVIEPGMIDMVFGLRVIVTDHPEAGCPLVIDAMDNDEGDRSSPAVDASLQAGPVAAQAGGGR